MRSKTEGGGGWKRQCEEKPKVGRVDRSSRLPAEALVRLECSADRLLLLKCPPCSDAGAGQQKREYVRGPQSQRKKSDGNRGFLLMSKSHRIPTVLAACGLTSPWKRVGKTQSKPIVSSFRCKTAACPLVRGGCVFSLRGIVVASATKLPDIWGLTIRR